MPEEVGCLKSYTRNEDVACRNIGGLYLLIPFSRNAKIGSANFLITNHVGGYIWELLLYSYTQYELIEKLSSRYSGVDKETLRRDLDEVLKVLIKYQFIIEKAL
jgi:hypothetical protein